MKPTDFVHGCVLIHSSNLDYGRRSIKLTYVKISVELANMDVIRYYYS